MLDKNARLALNLGALVVGMLMLAYASVPLYRLFCQVTGFGGTPKIAASQSATVTDRKITVRFNADTDPNLAWEFKPAQLQQEVYVGENMVSHYTARNLENRPVQGHATYNVVPNKAGAYFAKINCFCFEQQVLQAGEERDLPVTFFLDPALLRDPEMADVHTITLSYTFFAVTKK